MDKDRLAVFTDAVLAIIMTILVLEYVLKSSEIFKKDNQPIYFIMWPFNENGLYISISFDMTSFVELKSSFIGRKIVVV